MKGIFCIVLMAMMLMLVAPMTVMAGGMGHAPVLALTMEVGPDIMAGKVRAGPGDLVSILKELLIGNTLIDYGSGTVSDAIANKDMILMRPTATAAKAGGAAILRSGEPRLVRLLI